MTQQKKWSPDTPLFLSLVDSFNYFDKFSVWFPFFFCSFSAHILALISLRVLRQAHSQGVQWNHPHSFSFLSCHWRSTQKSTGRIHAWDMGSDWCVMLPLWCFIGSCLLFLCGIFCLLVLLIDSVMFHLSLPYICLVLHKLPYLLFFVVTCMLKCQLDKKLLLFSPLPFSAPPWISSLAASLLLLRQCHAEEVNLEIYRWLVWLHAVINFVLFLGSCRLGFHARGWWTRWLSSAVTATTSPTSAHGRRWCSRSPRLITPWGRFRWIVTTL